MRYSHDDRRASYCDVFPEIGKGDINISIVEPGSIMMWHRHQFQSDYQLVVKGALKIGMCNFPNILYPAVGLDDEYVVRVDDAQDRLATEWREKYREISINDLTSKGLGVTWPLNEPKVEWHYLSERNANEGPLYIPPGLWHGCYNYTNEQAILVYHITNKWDGDDEDRCDVDTMKWPVEREAK